MTAGRCPAPAPARRAVLRGQRQGAALHPRLRGGRSCADSGRALPCTRACAAGARGTSPSGLPSFAAAGRELGTSSSFTLYPSPRHKDSGAKGQLRDELWADYPEIEIVDFSLCNLEVFNQCEHENALLMAVPQWEGVHPLLKILPVNWNHSIPFGLLHSPTPSPNVRKLIRTVARVTADKV